MLVAVRVRRNVQDAGLHCPSHQELHAFVAHALPDDDSDRIRDHLDACDPCRLGIMAGLSVRRTEPVGSADLELASDLRLGHFEIVRRLGAGGMGVVYEAIDQRLGRAVALKLVRGSVDGGDAMLLAEARAMARIRHPAVLAVYEADTVDGSVYLATELIPGATLRDHLLAATPTVAERLALYRIAAQGLAAAHAHGVIHRDFKPDNVLVEPGVAGGAPRVLVADFGLAAAMRPGSDLAIGWSSGGTPGYMAPEQLERRSHDERVDVFSFTVALWESLFGARPFAGSTVLPATPKLPRAVADVLLRGLAIDPACRPSLLEIDAALRPRVQSRRAVTLGLTAILGLVGVAGVALAARSTTRPVTADDRSAMCASAPTPARATAGWQDRALAAGTPVWVRSRVAATLGDRDHEVVALQRSVCAVPDDEAQRAWRACRADQAIEETELAQAFATAWPSYDHLEDALSLPWPSTCASRAARLDLVVAPSAPVARVMNDVARAALARARFAAIAGRSTAHWQRELAGARAAGAIAGSSIEIEALQLEAAFEFGLGMTARLARLERSVELAERGGFSSAAAQGWLALALARGDAKIEAAQIDVAYAQASWAIDRAGDPPMLRARWHAAAAARAWQRSDLAGATEHARAAAKLAGSDPHRRRIGVLALAAAAAANADFAAQRTLLESLLADPMVVGASDPDAARLQAIYAECLYHLDQLDLAAVAAERAIAISRTASGAHDPLTAEYLVVRGMIELDQGHPETCMRSVDDAIAILTETVGKDHLSIGAALDLRASARAELHDWRGALADSETALALFSARLGPRVEEVIFARTQIGEQARMLGQVDRARASLIQALADARTTYGPEDPRTADVERSLAAIYATQGHPTEARALLEHAVAAQVHAGVPVAYLAQSQAELARLLDGEPQRARDLADRALAAWHGQPAWHDEYEDLARWRHAHRGGVHCARGSEVRRS
jgi:tetratricopeptide (TPR) repeat protein